MNIEFYGLLKELKGKRLQYEDAFNELQRQKNEIKENEKVLNERLAESEKQEKKVMEEAYREAQDIIAATKRQMNAILEEARKERRREALKQVEKAELQVEEKLKELRGERPLSIGEIKEGDTVFIGSIGYDATVVKIDRRQNRLRVKAGGRVLEVPASDLGVKRGRSAETVPSLPKIDEPKEVTPPVLNLIGLRVDEALSKLEPFLNHASLSDLREVTIIHGIGTGALLKAVREYLATHPLVEQYRSGKQGEGGNGVTVVTMK